MRDNLFTTKYAILHIPSNMFVLKYEENYKQIVKGANDIPVCLATPTFSKMPRLHGTRGGADRVISRITRTSKANRETDTKAILYGTETALDYKVVAIEVYWDFAKPKPDEQIPF